MAADEVVHLLSLGRRPVELTARNDCVEDEEALDGFEDIASFPESRVGFADALVEGPGDPSDRAREGSAVNHGAKPPEVLTRRAPSTCRGCGRRPTPSKIGRAAWT